MNNPVITNRVFLIPNHPDTIFTKELHHVYSDAINESLAVHDLPLITPEDPIARITVDVSSHERDLCRSIETLNDFDGIVMLNLARPPAESSPLGEINLEPMRWAGAFNSDALGILFSKLNKLPAKAIILHGSFSTASMNFYSRGVLVTGIPSVIDMRKRGGVA